MISETLEAIATNIENAYDELETKGATLPANKNIQNLANAIASIQTGGGEGGDDLVLYHATQTINGDKCTITLTIYNNEVGDNYWVGTKTTDNKQELFLISNETDATLSLQEFINIRNGRALFAGLSNEKIMQLISSINTSSMTDMTQMFMESGIVIAPNMNTSNVTNMQQMFESCLYLTAIPQYDTSSVINMDYMFYINPVGTEALAGGLDISLPVLNTSNVISMRGMFYYRKNLTQIPRWDLSKVEYLDFAFAHCVSLESILAYGIKVSFDISASTQFTESALVEILNNLATVTTAQTLTMGATNLAKLTQAEIDIAINKGWTLA